MIHTDLNLAKNILDKGGVVSIPTETVYGLAANGTTVDAVKKIFEVKGRPSNNPLILHFPSMEAIIPYVKGISEEARLLATAFWPGPLTLLLPKSDRVPEMVTAGLPRVAVRVPNHPLTLQLLKKIDYPLAAPSANPSGYISPTQPNHVAKQLGSKVPLILDGGPCQKGLESTILGWDDDGWPIIYRKGVITTEDIQDVLDKAPKTIRKKTIEAPGMLSSHYSPHTKTLLIDSNREVLSAYRGLKIGLISFQSSYDGKVSVQKEILLSNGGSLSEVAQKLYTAMHELDELELDVILIEKVPDIGIGKAINDRLLRSVGGHEKK